MSLHIDALKNVVKPITQAKGLPNRYYVEEQTLAEEREKVFGNNWAAVGFAKDVPENADAKPVKFLDQPLLLVRGSDGVVRVFQNICRHRGMILVNEPKKIRGVIRCPYHSWCYDLTGKLKTTPHVGGPGQNTDENIDRSTLGLIEVRSHVWQDIIFINLSGEAPPFEEFASGLISRWEEFEQPSYFGGKDSEFELTVKSNWKLAVENYCESYHLPWVHPGLNAYSKLEDHYHIIEQGRYSGQGTLVYNPTLSKKQKFSNYGGLSKRWDKQAEYISLFPNVLLGIHRDHRFAIILVPDTIEQTTERVAIFYASDEMLGDEFADMRKMNTVLWKGIFEEDIFVVEGMQSGRHAQTFDGGKFSPVMDEPTWVFHHWIATQLLASQPVQRS